MDDKCLWLIDAGYLFNAQRTVASDYNFDYLKLKMKIEENKMIWRAYYLNSTPNPPTDKQDQFHSWLRLAAPRGPKIIPRLYQLKKLKLNSAYCTECGEMVRPACPKGSGHQIMKQQQKGVDVGIATLALVHQDKYDTLILSSGDGDLNDAIKYFSEAGKRIILLVFKSGVSPDLQVRADEVLWLDDFAEEIRRNSTNSAQPRPTTYC